MIGFYRFCTFAFLGIGIFLVFVVGDAAKTAGYISLLLSAFFGLWYLTINIIYTKAKHYWENRS